jgi:hypothetical protein
MLLFSAFLLNETQYHSSAKAGNPAILPSGVCGAD